MFGPKRGQVSLMLDVALSGAGWGGGWAVDVGDGCQTSPSSPQDVGLSKKKMYCMAVSRATERSCAAAAELKTMQGGGSERGLGGATPSARELHGWGCGGGVGGGLILSPLSSHHLSLTWL